MKMWILEWRLFRAVNHTQKVFPAENEKKIFFHSCGHVKMQMARGQWTRERGMSPSGPSEMSEPPAGPASSWKFSTCTFLWPLAGPGGGGGKSSVFIQLLSPYQLCTLISEFSLFLFRAAFHIYILFYHLKSAYSKKMFHLEKCSMQKTVMF